MQHIGVVQKDESGRKISELPGGLLPAVFDAIPTSGSCLRFVDPYGDTVFNYLQIPVLIAELEALNQANPELGTGPLVQFLKSCQGRHSYVHFIGD